MLFDELHDAEESLANVLSERVKLALDSSVQKLDSPTHNPKDISKRR